MPASKFPYQHAIWYAKTVQDFLASSKYETNNTHVAYYLHIHIAVYEHCTSENSSNNTNELKIHFLMTKNVMFQKKKKKKYYWGVTNSRYWLKCAWYPTLCVCADAGPGTFA